MKKGSCGSFCWSLSPSCSHSSTVAVGQVAVAVDGRASHALLERVQVLDGDDPPQPAATFSGPRADSLAEDGLVGGRMVQNLDHFEVLAVGQRQDPVAGAEARVETSVGEVDARAAMPSRCAVASSPSGPAA